ncbi:DNA helicase TIP49, TBP-interacting protein, partial [Trachipleistophora hominis]
VRFDVKQALYFYSAHNSWKYLTIKISNNPKFSFTLMTIESKDHRSIDRIGLHSHIHSLGVVDNRTHENSGLVGQEKARIALSLSRERSRIVLLHGPRNSGKSALATALSKDTENCVYISAAQVENVEDLDKLILSVQVVVLMEETTVIEGEIVSISGNSVILRTTDMESTFTVREVVGFTEGDVLQIVNGTIKRMGTTRTSESVDPNVPIVGIPKGNLIQTKILKKRTTFADLIENNDKNADKYLIYEKVREWINENKAEIPKSTLIIDEAHLLDERLLNYLFKISELEYSPFILLVSKDDINETRLLKIRTSNYTDKEKEKIFKLRGIEEEVTLNDELITNLLNIERNMGMRYAINVITLVGALSSFHQRDPNLNDLKCVSELFLDVGRAKEGFQ